MDVRGGREGGEEGRRKIGGRDRREGGKTGGREGARDEGTARVWGKERCGAEADAGSRPASYTWCDVSMAGGWNQLEAMPVARAHRSAAPRVPHTSVHPTCALAAPPPGCSTLTSFPTTYLLSAARSMAADVAGAAKVRMGQDGVCWLGNRV